MSIALIDSVIISKDKIANSKTIYMLIYVKKHMKKVFLSAIPPVASSCTTNNCLAAAEILKGKTPVLNIYIYILIHVNT